MVLLGSADVCEEGTLAEASRHVNESRFRNWSGRFLFVGSGVIQQIFAVESGILGFGIWNELKESGISLTIGIQNPSFIDKESRIHGLKSRIQDFLRFPYIWQKTMIQLRWSRLVRSDHIHYRPRCRTFCVYNFKKFQSRWFLQCISLFFSRNSGRRVLSVLDSIHGCSHLKCFLQEFGNSCCSSRHIYTCL